MKPSRQFSDPDARRQRIAEGIAFLRAARDAFRDAGAPKALERTRLALSSAEGAARNAEHIEFREYREQRKIEDACEREFTITATGDRA